MSALIVHELRKRYGSFVAVDGVSFTVPRGRIFGLLGPNGSGKTSTLACALGLRRPDGGRVEVLGVPAARIAATRGRVAAVLDAPALVPALTVRQNLGYARRLLGHRGGRSDEEALEAVGLGALAERRAGGLSLGQGRRLAIARALIGSPELVVLDEPLSGLDTPGVRRMLALFTSLRDDGLTVLLSSHRLPEMERVVDDVAILLDGRLVHASSLDALLGGGRETVRVEVDDAPRAAAALRRLSGLDAVEADPARGVVVVEPGGVPVAAVNRTLVRAGVQVTRLAPARVGLQEAFEALLDHHDAREVV